MFNHSIQMPLLKLHPTENDPNIVQVIKILYIK